MSDSLPLFTAARIASALGRDKRGVLRVLRKIAPAGQHLVQGRQFADAWSVESLPEYYREELKRLAKIKGFRDIPHILQEGVARWKPPIDLSEIAEHHVTKAVRLKAALARAIALYSGPVSGIDEIRRIAWEDYQKEFGLVSERTVRRALDRVIERDAGEENFDDVALYLDDRISKAKGQEAILPGLLSSWEQAVFRYLGSVKRPAEPTLEETNLIWFAVCESLHAQTEEGMPVKKARRAMISFLGRSAVVLSKNAHALKKLFKRKYARYLECNGDFNAMRDQRAEKSGWKRAHVLSEQDRKLIVAHAGLQEGGRIAPALRDLREDGMLSYELEMHHTSDPASKSYVPLSIRKQVQADVRRLKNPVHGPRTHRLNGPHVTRDYSLMSAGDWYQADDVTLPVYYYEETDRGPVKMRGQFLVMIDVRTDFVLGFMLISERNYNSLAIRSLITICATKHGLPRRGFYFEKGIWKSSKIIAGSRNAVPFEHADQGLRGLGMELHHAQLPRGKVIERAIGQLQNRIEGFPGYVGRDERHDVRERVQRQFLDVDAGRRPVDKCLLSKQQYCEELANIIDAHNAEAQEGRIDGMSPAEAWEQLQGEAPRQGFSGKWRYVLARDVSNRKVQSTGITLRYGNKSFVYYDSESGKHEGEQVLAWFDPMAPELLVCTDLNRENMFCVKRALDLPAVDASTDQIHDAMAQINDHLDYGRSLYWTSKNTLKERHYIKTVVDAGTLRMGEAIAQQTERVAAQNEEKKQRARKNCAVIENKNLPRELLQSADSLPTDVVDKIGNFLTDTKE